MEKENAIMSEKLQNAEMKISEFDKKYEEDTKELREQL